MPLAVEILFHLGSSRSTLNPTFAETAEMRILYDINNQPRILLRSQFRRGLDDALIISNYVLVSRRTPEELSFVFVPYAIQRTTYLLFSPSGEGRRKLLTTNSEYEMLALSSRDDERLTWTDNANAFSGAREKRRKLNGRVSVSGDLRWNTKD